MSRIFKSTLSMCMLIFLFACRSYAQLSGSNQLQYQLGNLPDAKPSDRSALYNQLNLNYYHQNIQIGGRLEFFMTADRDQEYAELQQKYIQYQTGNFEIKIGNFYESLGQGLLLRTYEIPGVIYEDVGSRQQYGFYKDIEGAELKYYNTWLNIKAIYGHPLDLLKPPAKGHTNRRPNLIQGGEISIIVLDYFSPGILYLHSNNEFDKNEFTGINSTGSFNFGLQYYLEYAQSLREQDNYFQLGKNGQHAMYGSISQSFDMISISLEIKDYQNFTLNFNDPPSLVKEHARTLLNRGTHVIQPLNERGYQIEGIINLGSINTMTLNHAFAENNFGNHLSFFREYYADLNYYITKKIVSKVFIDWSQDEIVNNVNRWTGGILIDQQLTSHWSSIMDLQAQTFERDYGAGSSFNHKVKNFLVDLAISYSPVLSIEINIEATHDPLESDTLFDLANTDYTIWAGSFINYEFNQNHTFSLFYGKRREGNACSGGICYEVQPFEGIEFTLNSIL
ncbi:MAG: DUF6029 family protein [Calditrichaceae bacterium]